MTRKATVKATKKKTYKRYRRAWVRGHYRTTTITFVGKGRMGVRKWVNGYWKKIKLK